MASNKTVVILAPNGRRQTVKVSPNTTILQIIEEVCTKQGLKSEEFDLRHHKNVMDINATMGFSGLPNNAQLDLIPSTKPRVETDVTIGLQLENGNRLLGTFKPNTSIYDVLLKLSPEDLNPDKNTVIIYMRRELYGIDLLKKTDLKSLGLTSGRAMFRLIHKKPEELKVQANISAPIPAKPVEEKPYMRKFQAVESPPSKPYPSNQTNKPTNVHENVAKKPCVEENVPPPQQQNLKKTNMVDLIKNEKKKQDQNVNQKYKETTLNQQKPKTINIKDNKEEEEFMFLGDRNAMLFSLETAQNVRTEDLPDDFFELTIEDAKKLFRDIKKRRMELENSPLMTSALRNLEESKRQLNVMNRYKKTIIRVQFPDRAVLQGTFLITEDIKCVMEFVRSYLENKNLDFYLYTTPPKSVLKTESVLFEIGCVPGALLYFGVKSNDANEGRSQYLRKELCDKFTTSSVASMAAAKMRKEARRWDFPDEADDISITPDDVNVGASTSNNGNYVDYDKPSTSQNETAPKLPKWFKNQ
ncbi:tether containing UBX domain for GLUT4 [Onthophagus taurus]|uniref:tether containing UBX domain for GLUT4 n=1 Tax=Onthophagus taurus TaxID=166361 RepID=UPI000C209406|nr:tether containing UBX domain for GLUT4 [Onthophagus taurus]